MGNFFLDLRDRMHRDPDKIFLDCGDGGTISYADADRISAKLANKLGSLGIAAGDRLTVQVKKSKEAVFLYLACLRSGIICHPLNTAYVQAELEHFLLDAEPAALLCAPESERAYQSLASRCGVRHVLTLDQGAGGTLMHDLEEFSSNHPVVERRDDHTAVLLYTSGTTGKPKGAMITHGNLRSNALSLCQVWGWRADDVLIHILPLFHVHGLFVAMHCPMLNGSRIIFRQRFSPEETVNLIPQATVLMGVPTVYSRIVQEPGLTRGVCHDFRLFISGSAPLRPETFHEFEARTGHRILERYGMSEAGMISSNPLYGERIAGTVGYALPDVHLRVRSQDGSIAPPLETGVLEISGPNVFAGYWRNDAASRKAFCDDGFLVTGDLATLSDTGVLSIVGRETDLIISAGFNIYPREVELALNRIPGIAESTVFGVPHPDLGEAAAAAVIAESPCEIDPAEIQEALRANLSSFKLPRHIAQVSEFPRNAMGKIEKKRLREQFRDIFAAPKATLRKNGN